MWWPCSVVFSLALESKCSWSAAPALLIDWLVDWLTSWWIGWLTAWLINKLNGLINDKVELIDWLMVGSVTDWMDGLMDWYCKLGCFCPPLWLLLGSYIYRSEKWKKPTQKDSIFMTLEYAYEQYFCYCQYSRKYLHAAKADNSPHIFAVADQSYQSMVHNQHHQVITALFFPSVVV